MKRSLPSLGSPSVRPKRPVARDSVPCASALRAPARGASFCARTTPAPSAIRRPTAVMGTARRIFVFIVSLFLAPALFSRLRLPSHTAALLDRVLAELRTQVIHRALDGSAARPALVEGIGRIAIGCGHEMAQADAQKPVFRAGRFAPQKRAPDAEYRVGELRRFVQARAACHDAKCGRLQLQGDGTAADAGILHARRKTFGLVPQ